MTQPYESQSNYQITKSKKAIKLEKSICNFAMHIIK